MSTYSGSNKSTGPLIVLNSKHMDEKKAPLVPHFTKSAKQEDGTWKVIGDCTGFTGKLVRVSPETKTIKDDKGKITAVKEMVKLLFQSDDSDESYLLSLTYRIASRDLFNSILNLEDLETPIDISYSRNKNGYEKFWLNQNGSAVWGKYPYEDLKAKIKMETKKGITTADNEELDAFFVEKLKEFNEKLAKVPASAPAPKQEYKNVASSEEDSQEIPF